MSLMSVIEREEDLLWWQEVANRRAIVHSDSEEARAQLVFSRILDAIIHFFANVVSEAYRNWYATARVDLIQDTLPKRQGLLRESAIAWALAGKLNEFVSICQRDAPYQEEEGPDLIQQEFGDPQTPEIGNTDTHEWDRVVARSIRILRLRQGELTEVVQNEANTQLKKFLTELPEGDEKKSAMEVYQAFGSRHQLSTICHDGQVTVKIMPQEFLARTWIFTQLCLDPETAQERMVVSLSNPANAPKICDIGKMVHFVTNVFLGRMDGIGMRSQTPEDWALAFFLDESYPGNGIWVKEGERRRALLNESGMNAEQAKLALCEDAITWFQRSSKEVQQDDFLNALNKYIDEYFQLALDS